MTGDQTWSDWSDPPNNDLRPPAPPTTQLPLATHQLLDLRKFAVGVARELVGLDSGTDLLNTARDIAEFVQHGTVPDVPEPDPLP